MVRETGKRGMVSQTIILGCSQGVVGKTRLEKGKLRKNFWGPALPILQLETNLCAESRAWLRLPSPG